MKSFVLPICLLAAVAVLSATTATIVINSEPDGTPTGSEEQRLRREKFFGSSKADAPIAKGQEMRPRW